MVDNPGVLSASLSIVSESVGDIDAIYWPALAETCAVYSSVIDCDKYIEDQ